MNLTPNFTLAELTRSDTAVRLKLDNTPPPEVIANLRMLAATGELVRARVAKVYGEKPIIASSGYRAPAVNIAVGGSGTSDHTKGLALDFNVPGLTPLQVCTLIADDPNIKYDQLIHEFGRWVHIGIGPRMRRRNLTIFKGTGYQPGLLTEAEARALAAKRVAK